jgi:hypothetical protein
MKTKQTTPEEHLAKFNKLVDECKESFNMGLPLDVKPATPDSFEGKQFSYSYEFNESTTRFYFAAADPATNIPPTLFEVKDGVVRIISKKPKPKRIPRKEKKRRKAVFHRKTNP